MKRIVLDTNILISALFWKGQQREIFNAALDKKYIALTAKHWRLNSSACWHTLSSPNSLPIMPRY